MKKRLGLFLTHEFKKSTGQRYRIVGVGFNPELPKEEKERFNFVEFQEVRQQRDMGEYAEVLVGEVFTRSLDYLWNLVDEKKIILV